MSRVVPTARLRNIGIMAHIDAGKTTTTERVLYYTGRVRRMGEVHEGSTTTDWMPEEQERGITITAASISCHWTSTRGGDAHQINVIDTPGHVDFTVEVERSVRVLDGAVVVLCAQRGVEPQTEAVWRQADRYGVPRVVFVNKLDRVGADLEEVLVQVRARLGARPVLLQVPIGVGEEFAGLVDLISQQALYYDDTSLGARWEVDGVPEEMVDEVELAREELLELLGELDECFLLAYLEERATEEEIRASLRRLTVSGEVVPVLCGSSLHNIGVQPLLDAVLDYLPSPEEARALEARLLGGESLSLGVEGPFVGLAFKVMGDAQEGPLTWLRVYAGELRVGDQVLNSGRGCRERVSGLVRMHANDREEIGVVRAGDIAAVQGLRWTRTGDTLCDERREVRLASIPFPEPVVEIRIEPQTEGDGERLTAALQALALEDPSFQVRQAEESGETLIAGMGELHLEIIASRLRREFRVEARVGRPQVAYREMLEGPGRGEGRFTRQVGGRGMYGHAILALEPLSPGSGLEYVVLVGEEEVPRAYAEAVGEGVREAARRGVRAGYPLVDLRVSLVGGSCVLVDASESAYRLAGAEALRAGALEGGVLVMEPLMVLEVIAPSENVGEVIGALTGRRGRVQELSQRGGFQVLRGEAPLGEMFGYATRLRSMTQGRGTYSMQFSRYSAVPKGPLM